MSVLGIDPGFGRCGMAVLEKRDGKEYLVHSVCVETDPQMPFSQRLLAVADMCKKNIDHYSPQAVALERLFLSTNQKTAMQVAEVRGALLYIAESSHIPVFEYTPAQIKTAVSGSGRADKQAIAHMIHALVRIEKKIERDDEYDAIAIGLTHLASTGKHTRMI